jgi:protein TonB
LILGVADYHPSSPRSRVTAVSVVLGAHVLLLLAVLSIGTVVVVASKTPMLVRLLPEAPAARPELPSRTVPLPQLRKPEIVVPEPPRFEVMQTVEAVERPAPPPTPKAVPVPQPVAVAAPAPAVEPPRFDLAYLDNPAPAYPVFAKRSREQGTVLLRVGVDADGRVTRIEIEKTSGSERLDHAALAAVKRWRFAPARSAGQPIAGVALVPVNFKLEG